MDHEQALPKPDLDLLEMSARNLEYKVQTAFWHTEDLSACDLKSENRLTPAGVLVTEQKALYFGVAQLGFSRFRPFQTSTAVAKGRSGKLTATSTSEMLECGLKRIVLGRF